MRNMFPPFSNSKLLIHIAFHHAKDRVEYLKRVIQNLQNYSFSKIDIVIDTNTDLTLKNVPLESTNPNASITFKIHNNLSNPYLLTWAHRPNMRAALNSYDYFMYLEDDIYVPYRALERWRLDSQFLYPLGYIRGFLRVEYNQKGTLVCTDQYKRSKIRNLVLVQDSLFYLPHVPYQAFWICSHNQMVDFINGPAWENNNSDWCIRERAASGMNLLSRKNHKKQKHNMLIPINDRDQLPEEVFVYHLPNTYADNPNVAAAKLSVNQIMNLGPFAGAYKAFLKYLGGSNKISHQEPPSPSD